MSQFRSEVIKLRTVRSHWVLWVIGLVFPYVITSLVAVFADEFEFRDPDLLVEVIAGVAVVSAMLFGVVATLSITSEFAHQTIRPTLVARPARLSLLATKAALVGLVGAVLGTVVAFGNFAVGAAILSGRGASIGFGEPGVLAALAGSPAFYALVSLFGFALGTCFRSSPAAIVTLVLWPLLVEGILALVLTVAGVDDADRFLPYNSGLQLISTVASNAGQPYGRLGGGLVLAAFVGVILAVGAVLTQRRDV